jgi:hypothetical protein
MTNPTQKKSDKPEEQKRFDDALTRLLNAPPQHKKAKKKQRKPG